MAKSKFEKDMEEKLHQIQDLIDEIVVMTMEFQKGKEVFPDRSSVLLSVTVAVLEMQLRRSRMMYVDGGADEETPEALKVYAHDHGFAMMLWGTFKHQLELISKLKTGVKKNFKRVDKMFEEESKSIEERLSKMAEEEAYDCDNCDGKGCSCGCNKD